MKEQSIEDYTNIIEKNINSDLKTITTIVYKYDIANVMSNLKDLSIDKQNEILECGINKYLKIIQSTKFEYVQYIIMQRDIDDIFEFFTEDEKMDEMNDSVDVASDLVLKAIGHNNRKLTLPISVNNVIDYSIHNSVSNDSIHLEILYIYLYLASFCYLLKNKDYSKEIKNFSKDKWKYKTIEL